MHSVLPWNLWKVTKLWQEAQKWHQRGGNRASHFLTSILWIHVNHLPSMQHCRGLQPTSTHCKRDYTVALSVCRMPWLALRRMRDLISSDQRTYKSSKLQSTLTHLWGEHSCEPRIKSHSRRHPSMMMCLGCWTAHTVSSCHVTIYRIKKDPKATNWASKVLKSVCRNDLGEVRWKSVRGWAVEGHHANAD